jgi:NAD(P)-dependent dehydrogenase (short-subunit alcohol dehydrogenase family)
MVNQPEFDGKRALVTGGSKGIGQAVAARLRAGGATVLTTARSLPSDLCRYEVVRRGGYHDRRRLYGCG